MKRRFWFAASIITVAGMGQARRPAEEILAGCGYPPNSVVTEMRHLPASILQDLAKRTPDMVEAGQRFQDTDEITERLPYRRFVMAVKVPRMWIVTYEHGSLVHYHTVTYTGPRYGNDTYGIAGLENLVGNPCAAITAINAGVRGSPGSHF